MTGWHRWARMVVFHLVNHHWHALQASSREEHPAWFADLSTNAHTKEEFMNKNCQAGIHIQYLWSIHHFIFQHLHSVTCEGDQNAVFLNDAGNNTTQIPKSQCTTGPSKRLFGKGRDSIERGEVQWKAGAFSPRDGRFQRIHFNLSLDLKSTRWKNSRLGWKQLNTMVVTLIEAVKRRRGYATILVNQQINNNLKQHQANIAMAPSALHFRLVSLRRKIQQRSMLLSQRTCH